MKSNSRFTKTNPRASVKVTKSLTRIRGSARLLEGIDPTPGSIRFE